MSLWDVERGTLLGTLEGHAKKVVGLTFSRCGRRVLSLAEDAIRIWDLERRVCLATHDEDAPPGCLTVDSAGDLAKIGGRGTTARLWDLERCQPVKTFCSNELPYGESLSSDGRFVLARSMRGHYPACDYCVDLWHLESVEKLVSVVIPAGEDHIEAIELSPDDRFALVASADESLRLVDLVTGECHRVGEHTQNALVVAFTPQGELALSGGRDRNLRLWALDWSLDAEAKAPDLAAVHGVFDGIPFFADRYVVRTDGLRSPAPEEPPVPVDDHETWRELIAARDRRGLPTKQISFERLEAMLNRKRAGFLERENCRKVSFSVASRPEEVGLQATVVRDHLWNGQNTAIDQTAQVVWQKAQEVLPDLEGEWRARLAEEMAKFLETFERGDSLDEIERELRKIIFQSRAYPSPPK